MSLTSLTTAQQIVLDATSVLGCEKVGLLDALGRVLGEDIIAPRANPPWDNSAMDGFAVRAADTFGASEEESVRLRLNDEILATGILPGIEVEAGTATTIATGGMLTRGADAVAPIEVTDADPTDAAFVRLTIPVSDGDLEAADRMAVDFLRELHPHITEALPFDNKP